MIKLTNLLKEDTFTDFLKKEQDVFLKKPSYQEYITQVSPFLSKGDKKSEWLFNHHAAELAWEENKSQQAKKHIQLSVKNSPLPLPWPDGLTKGKNTITHVMDFIMNQRGSRADLQVAIGKIGDSTEKRTAQKLMNNPKYGGKLK
jgi:hypothetical protein